MTLPSIVIIKENESSNTDIYSDTNTLSLAQRTGRTKTPSVTENKKFTVSSKRGGENRNSSKTTRGEKI